MADDGNPGLTVFLIRLIYLRKTVLTGTYR